MSERRGASSWRLREEVTLSHSRMHNTSFTCFSYRFSLMSERRGDITSLTHAQHPLYLFLVARLPDVRETGWHYLTHACATPSLPVSRSASPWCQREGVTLPHSRMHNTEFTCFSLRFSLMSERRVDITSLTHAQHRLYLFLVELLPDVTREEVTLPHSRMRNTAYTCFS